MSAQEVFPMVLGVGFVVVGAAVGLYIQKSLTESRAKQWEMLAQELGLSYTRQGWLSTGFIMGTMGEVQVEVGTFYRGRGKHRRIFTKIVAHLRPSLGLNLHIYREGFLSEVGKVFGMQDLKTGDRDFDDRFIVKGSDEGGILSLLGPDVRRALLDYERLSGYVELNDAQFYWESGGVEANREKMRAILEEQVRLVRVMQLRRFG
jgi:hypothetical protein